MAFLAPTRILHAKNRRQHFRFWLLPEPGLPPTRQPAGHAMQHQALQPAQILVSIIGFSPPLEGRCMPIVSIEDFILEFCQSQCCERAAQPSHSSTSQANSSETADQAPINFTRFSVNSTEPFTVRKLQLQHSKHAAS